MEEEIIKLYESGISTNQLEKRFGLSHGTVPKILRKHGVHVRTRKEALQKYARYNTCVVCGKIFRPRENWLSTKNGNRKTCSPECLTQFLHDININTHMKGGDSQIRYQRIRRELKPDICEWCNAVPPVRIDTHHKDRDKSNNTIENIMVLCVHCHAYLHYVEDYRGLQGWKPQT
jgi:RNase P subunit RPR2